MKKTTARPALAAQAAERPPHGVMSAVKVLEELSDIAAACPGEEDGPPVKMADKLKALEMLRKYHEQTAERSAASGEGLTVRLEVLDGTDP